MERQKLQSTEPVQRQKAMDYRNEADLQVTLQSLAALQEQKGLSSLIIAFGAQNCFHCGVRYEIIDFKAVQHSTYIAIHQGTVR
jgi:hypothetical protein